jgi:hypothetical protein
MPALSRQVMPKSSKFSASSQAQFKPIMNSIDCFPNSGHQYHFVALEPEFLKANPAIHENCQTNSEPWKPHAEHKWLRYRHGANDSELGIWLVVESNLGASIRGFIYQPYRDVTPTVLGENHKLGGTPYAATSENLLPQEPVEIEIHQDQKVLITWKKPNAAAIDVDLIVDFGNTRTVAMLLENSRVTNDLRQICHPVRFTPRGIPYAPLANVHAAEDPLVIVDSWTILHEPVFSQHEPPGTDFRPEIVPKIKERPAVWGEDFVGNLFGRPKTIKERVGETHYVPQMFIELSPAILGGGNCLDGARHILYQLDLSTGANYFLSSPKRYAWDTDEVGGAGLGYWNVVLNRYSKPDPTQLPRLAGPLLMFMDTDGRDWEIEDAPNERGEASARPHQAAVPVHPRSDALTWVALSVIEKAYFQINSASYRKLLNTPWVPRRLRNVLVTFPAGWTGVELDCYLKKWQKAINIFTLGHLEERALTTEGGQRPELITRLDEAVASQLPIIYSEILRMQDGESWIELVGRGRGSESRVRIMNVDIGGGTTDVSIVQYGDTQPGASVHLESKLLFKNSHAIAGDALVKRIIETILLPRFGSSLPRESPERLRFKQFLCDPPQQFLAADSAFQQKMARITRLVLIPIVNTWLGEIAADRYGSPENPGRGLAPSEMTAGDGSPSVDQAVTREFNELGKKFIAEEFEFLPYDQPLDYDPVALRKCIEQEFKPLIQSLSKLVASFGCDQLIISGKPSELPEVRSLLCRELPLLPQQIISVKHFPAGSWYPLGGGDGKIQDAKTITVVGAALYQAMQNTKIPGWRLTCFTDSSLLTENYWGQMPPKQRPELFDEFLYLKPGENEAVCNILLGTCIGRKRFPSRHVWPDQIYKLRWRKGKERPNETPELRATLSRERSENSVESLKLLRVEAKDSKNRDISFDDVELQLCTLPENVFWMDSPRFEIYWPD